MYNLTEKTHLPSTGDIINQSVFGTKLGARVIKSSKLTVDLRKITNQMAIKMVRLKAFWVCVNANSQ